MGTSSYFNATPKNLTSEQGLLEDLIVESINLYGTMCFFVPRGSRSTPDTIYGEDPVSQYTQAFYMPMYLQNVLGPGPTELFSKFGYTINDDFKYVVARKTFQKYVPSHVRSRPFEGDLLYIPAFNDLLEIKFVEYEQHFHPLGRRQQLFFTYELQVENATLSGERFRTGVPEIDQIGSDYDYTVTLSLSSTANTNVDFQIGETTFQNAANSTAVVKDWDSDTQKLQITDVAGLISVSQTIRGNTSNASYTVSSFNYSDFSDTKEVMADNVQLELEAEAILDLATDNPFGIP